ncbi:hypothetical protein [Amycolatopsis sp. NPDC003731]
MTEQEFAFDFRWADRLKLRDREEFEDISGYAWQDLENGGALRTDKNGKVMFTTDPDTGERWPLRTLKTEMVIAWIYLLKRTEDPNVTLEDIRNLPGYVYDEIMAKQFKIMQEVIEDAKKDLAEQEEATAQAKAKSGSRASKK